MITYKINKVATQDYYFVTLIVSCINLKPKMFMKILVRIRKYLVLAIILLSQTIMMIKAIICW